MSKLNCKCGELLEELGESTVSKCPGCYRFWIWDSSVNEWCFVMAENVCRAESGATIENEHEPAPAADPDTGKTGGQIAASRHIQAGACAGSAMLDSRGGSCHESEM